MVWIRFENTRYTTKLIVAYRNFCPLRFLGLDYEGWVYGIQYTVYSIQYTVHSIQYTVYSIQYTVYSTQYTVYSIQYTVYSIQYTVHSIRYTVYSIQYTVYSTQYTVYSIQYTVYSIQYTVHSIQYTVYSIQYTKIKKNLIYSHANTPYLMPIFVWVSQMSIFLQNSTSFSKIWTLCRRDISLPLTQPVLPFIPPNL